MHTSAILLAAILAAGAPLAANPVTLNNPAAASGPHEQFGASTALSDRFVLVGEPGNRTRGAQAGAAHVFDAKNGRHLRRLLAPDALAGHRFGAAVAISGNRALIGAPGASAGRGRAYLFELSSGRLLRRIEPHPQVSAGGGFGAAVALNGRHAVIGAPYDMVLGAANLGSAHVVDLSTGEFLHSKTSIYAPDSAYFGFSVALDGKVFVAGSPGELNQNSTRTGSAHVFDLLTGERLHRLLAADGNDGDEFGMSVAVGSGWVAAGAPGKSSLTMTDFGNVYVFDLANGTQLSSLQAGSPSGQQRYGHAVSISGQHLTVGAPGESSGNAAQAGAVYVIEFTPYGSYQYRLAPPVSEAGLFYGLSLAVSGQRLVAGYNSNAPHANAGGAELHSRLAAGWSQRVVSVAVSSNPSVGGQRMQKFVLPSFNTDGAAAYGANLAGGPSKQAAWAEFSPGATPTLLARGGGQLDPQTRAGGLVSLVNNKSTDAVLETRVTGGAALYRVNGQGARALLFKSGAPAPGLGGPLLRDFSSPCQFGADDRLVASYRLRGGVGNVTAANDSGVLVFNHAGNALLSTLREGGNIGNFLGAYGQFLSRSAIRYNTNQLAFAAHRMPPSNAAPQLAVFTRPASAGQTQMIAHSGKSVPQVPGAVFRGFLGETLHGGELIYRASLSGPGAVVSAGNREGLWLGEDLCLRQGWEIQTGGPRVSRILRFWPSITDHVMTLVRLKGKGVNSGNDLALLLIKRNGALQVLMREGASVEGSEGSRVGVIQRVEACPLTGYYAILASLTGSSAANQALFTGQTNVGNPNERIARRLPSMKLRKGILSYTFVLGGIKLDPFLHATGAGGTGHRVVLNPQGSLLYGVLFKGGPEVMMEGAW